jgi:hypothetical protein
VAAGPARCGHIPEHHEQKHPTEMEEKQLFSRSKIVFEREGIT